MEMRVELADWRRPQGSKEAFWEAPLDRDVSLRDAVDAAHDQQTTLFAENAT
jgi:hypothetical protein